MSRYVEEVSAQQRSHFQLPTKQKIRISSKRGFVFLSELTMC